jgi:hypothetical protein
MILVAVAILVGVYFVATGRGGELAYEHADHAPLDLGPVSATDVALLRPPTAMWGYNMQVTDEALERISAAIRDRDVTIAFLQQRLASQTTQTTQASQTTQAAPASQTAQAAPAPQPAEPPLIHHTQHVQPPGSENPADPPADPSTGALAAEEQTR